MSSERSVIVALDVAGEAQALALAQQLAPELCRLKVGKALFTREGPALIRRLHEMGYEVFLDLKYHDIPNTVAEAVAAAADLGVWMVNVHAQGGAAMLQAARQAVDSAKHRPLLIAVTVLTSTDAAAWQALGHQQTIPESVGRLGALAMAAKFDGVVCSAQEATAFKSRYGTDCLTVTPGIRPGWAARDDQSRIMTPSAARQAGSDYLVVGRPITRADNPQAALKRILAELEGEEDESTK